MLLKKGVELWIVSDGVCVVLCRGMLVGFLELWFADQVWGSHERAGETHRPSAAVSQDSVLDEHQHPPEFYDTSQCVICILEVPSEMSLHSHSPPRSK